MNNLPSEPQFWIRKLLRIPSFAFICLITLCVASQAARAMGVQTDEQKAFRTDGNRTPLGFAADSKSAIFLNAINYDAIVEEIEFETGATKQLKFCKGAMLIDGYHELSLGRQWLIAEQPSCSRIGLFGLAGQKRADLLVESVNDLNHVMSPSGNLLLNGDKIQKITSTGLVDLKKLDRYGHGIFQDDETQLLIVSRSEDRQSSIISIYSVPTFAKTKELLIPKLKGDIRPLFWSGDSIALLIPALGSGNQYLDCNFAENSIEQPKVKLLGKGGGPWHTYWNQGFVDQMRFGKSWYARITANPHLAPEKGKVAASQNQPAFKLEIFDRKTDESLYVMTRDKPCHVIISPDGKRLIEQTSNTEFRFHDLPSKQTETRSVTRQQ